MRSERALSAGFGGELETRDGAGGGRIARRAGRVPRAVTAGRGYGLAWVERDLQELGVRTVAIPRRARPSPARKTIEHSRGFRRLVKWRTGCEGRISYLARLRLGPDPAGRHERRRHLVRARGIRPQPDQDQRPSRMTRPGPPELAAAPPLRLQPSDFSGRSN